MRMYLRIIARLIIIVLIMAGMAPGLFPGGDILVSLRFYEGRKGGDTEKSSVVTSYHLKPLFVGNIVSAAGVEQEKQELKRIFNLRGLKLMTGTQWGWTEGLKDKRFQVIILNGHEFIVKLALLEIEDGFKVEVMEKSKSGNKNLLDTTISLPEQKTAVFGFEDSMNKPYFLSFHREKNESVIREEPVPLSAGDRPKLVKRVSPVFPEDALKHRIEGKVILEVTTDAVGRVIKLLVLSGHPLLRKAAIGAVKQWQYQPYIIKGKAKPAVFTITVNFSLARDKKKEKVISRSIPDIWPTRGYLTSTFGYRLHPFTGKRTFHNGIDIAAAKGAKVTAAAAGQVTAVEFMEIPGNMVIIDHLNGYTSRYAQLESFTVKKGDRVKKGDIIGYVGSSGRSTAPHLHYEVRLDGKPINPMSLID